MLIIFLLGWPLEWTEIIVIFIPIFLPLLKTFQIDPIIFGVMVAVNLQTSFLSPPVAMAAFYLKGIAPPHVTLNQIYQGMYPFLAIQILTLLLTWLWPDAYALAAPVFLRRIVTPGAPGNVVGEELYEYWPGFPTGWTHGTPSTQRKKCLSHG